MSILTGPEILQTIKRSRALKEGWLAPPLPYIDITPFDESKIGPNSYDVMLSDQLLVYSLPLWNKREVLDSRQDNPTTSIIMDPDYGCVLYPETLYIGSTVERTVTAGLVPWLDGRSSIGRLGIQIHATAGRGDDGFGCGIEGGCSWTLEISVVHPVRVYPNLRIGQLTFFTISGERKPYQGRYSKQTEPTPSKLWEGDQQ